MLKLLLVILLTLGAPLSAHAQGMRPMNQVSIVALIITSGEETPVSTSVTHTLESLDAQVLTASAPNASQLRSILKRFASAAIDVDVALVYYDGAVLKIGDREFVAPGGITLRRGSDLLTKAIPLSALARATALAGSGGAVLVHSTGRGVSLINGVTLVETAPNARTGTSPILFASSIAARNLADALEAMAETTEDISLNDALNGLAALDGVSISQRPLGQAMLRTLPTPAPVEAAMNPAETGADSAAMVADMADETAPEAASGINLPQVGEAPAPTEMGTDITTDTPETAAQADEANSPPETDSTETAAEINTEINTESPEALAVDFELSLDVLRAMQGSLSRGQKRTLQQHLRNMGYYRGLIDGIFGPQTARAISAYQESIGANVTGILTPVQLEALSE